MEKIKNFLVKIVKFVWEYVRKFLAYLYSGLHNSVIISVCIASFFVALSAGILASGIENIMSTSATVSVKGTMSTNVTSDTGVYSVTLEMTGLKEDRKNLYKQFDTETDRFLKFLADRGVNDSDITSIKKGLVDEEVIEEYSQYNNDGKLVKFNPAKSTLTRNIRVDSSDVYLIKKLADSRLDLVNEEFELTGNPTVAYTYSKLADIRKDLLKDATRDAQERVESIASNTGQTVGKISDIDSGSISVYAEGDEDGNSYDTESINKTVVVTVRATFILY